MRVLSYLSADATNGAPGRYEWNKTGIASERSRSDASDGETNSRSRQVASGGEARRRGEPWPERHCWCNWLSFSPEKSPDFLRIHEYTEV